MRRGIALLLTTGLLMLAGCAGLPGVPEPRAVAVPVDAMACTDPLTGSATVPAGTVPPDVEIVAVMQCIEGETVEDDDGMWAAQVVERYEDGLGDLLSAIGAPNEPRWPGPCTADMVLAPDLWAETSDGRFLRLSFPLSGCGQPRGPAADAVSAALAELTVADRSVMRLGMTESFAASSVGCATQAAVMILALDEPSMPPGAEPPEDVQAVPFDLPELAAADDVWKLRVCVYGTARSPAGGPQPAGTSAGVFSGSIELPTAEARAAVAALAAADPAPAACALEASRIVVAHPILNGNSLAAPFTVELDGCGRAVDPGMQPRTAPPELVAALTP